MPDEGTSSTLRLCDLVMKRGTSGVAYVRASVEFSRFYRFCSVGGAAAGAIPAALTAAAEYGRQTGRGGFGGFKGLEEEIRPEGFVLGLFQATPALRPLFNILLSLLTMRGRLPFRLAYVGGQVLAQSSPWFRVGLVGVLAGAGAAIGIGIWPLVSGEVSALDALAITLFALGGLALLAGLALVGVVFAARRFAVRTSAALSDQWFGMCPGIAQDPGAMALTDWLHQRIQSLAGLAAERPLTFGDLVRVPANASVSDRLRLALVTTDVSTGRPVRLPLDRESPRFLYRRSDLERLFPKSIIAYLDELVGDGDADDLRPLPQEQMPIAMATRLSFSFPLLLSAVPLYTREPDVGLVQHLFCHTDISSSFPITFFDGQVPRDPTFRLETLDWRNDGLSAASSFSGFFRKIVRATRNWPDTLQQDIPGFRERVYDMRIRLSPEEGGLNLNAPPEITQRLLERGASAARAAISVQPGLLDLLSAEQPTPDAELEPAVEAFRATPGIAGTPVEQALDDAIKSYVDATKDETGLWRALRGLFARERHETVGEQEAVVELEAYWLTLPSVSGATAKLTVSARSSHETFASLRIAGMGGGPKFTIDLKRGISHEATECERITLSTKGTFAKVQVTRDGHVVATYPKLVGIEQDRLTWTFTPAVPPDPAEFGTPLSSEQIDASSSEGPTTVPLAISSGTMWDAGAGLSLQALGLEVSLGAQITYEREVSFEYVLPPRSTYIAERYAEFPAYLWTVLPVGDDRPS